CRLRARQARADALARARLWRAQHPAAIVAADRAYTPIAGAYESHRTRHPGRRVLRRRRCPCRRGPPAAARRTARLSPSRRHSDDLHRPRAVLSAAMAKDLDTAALTVDFVGGSIGHRF